MKGYLRGDSMRTLEMLKEKKKQLKLTNQEIADLSGIPLGTVQKVLSGVQIRLVEADDRFQMLLLHPDQEAVQDPFVGFRIIQR